MPKTSLAKPDSLQELPSRVIAALEAIDEHKGRDLVVLDMREVSAFTDFMVICTGRSEPHVQALSDAVEEELMKLGGKPDHIEGRSSANWILLDYFDLIVHVFTPEARGFYQLEKLWRDAPLLEWQADDDTER